MPSVVLHEGVNLRDLGGARGAGGAAVRPGVVFRSAAPIFYNKKRLAFLEGAGGCGVKAALDLRGKRELRQAPHFDSAREHGSALFPGGAAHHHVDLVEGATKRALYASTPWYVKLWWGVWYLLGWRVWVTVQAVKHLGMDVPGVQGLERLYGGIIDDGGPEVCRALEVLAERIEKKEYPVVVHCTAGKDRAGIICALLLLLVGVPEEDIVADYALSEAELAAHDYVVGSQHRQIKAALSKEILSASPPDAMRYTLRKIAAYGGAWEYLTVRCGVRPETLKTLQNGLTA
eukprot:TRINITY_DN1268_c0_g1_i3.p1 TRINITY_DN1268_c0_g1~~TRINITY_DN1268_c0_g1_i3.p1  ORF type:complete len:310 (+),score=107.00 TRINITY_DN1268_c0_g1_i3:64-930(+)